MLKSHWVIIPFNNNYERKHFECGEPILDNYLQQLAGQHAKSNISRTFLALTRNDSTEVLGFYSLSVGSICFDSLPAKMKKKLPTYPIPIARIGRLAVDKKIQGQGLGEYLLMDALKRCAALVNEIAMVGVVVNAKHEKAKKFYLRYGFCELTNKPLTLFISMQDIIAAMIE